MKIDLNIERVSIAIIIGASEDSAKFIRELTEGYKTLVSNDLSILLSEIERELKPIREIPLVFVYTGRFPDWRSKDIHALERWISVLRHYNHKLIISLPLRHMRHVGQVGMAGYVVSDRRLEDWVPKQVRDLVDLKVAIDQTHISIDHSPYQHILTWSR